MTVRKLYIETYGCQMNVVDSEIVVSILKKEGFEKTEEMNEADLILVNTCSIRENAEQRIHGRLAEFAQAKKRKPSILIGVIGCMAERLKQKLVEQEKMVDIVVGPDAYRDLPHLVKVAEGGQKAVNVLLSREEMYAEINPVRLGENHVSAFVSIMRGCDNMCAFCVVPFTRGRERSRDPRTILSEVQKLIADGYKEVTLIGQNVDKYQWMNEKTSENVSFAQLLEMTALLDPSFRVRFSTSYPQDLTDDVLFAMIRHENICKFIHLPVQSGSSRILELMKRGYTREWYMNRIEAIRRIIPDCGISTDFIAGFCTETEEEHQQTLSLMEWAAFDAAFMFKYSERPNTFAAHNYKDDIPDDVKTRRLNEIIELQNRMSLESNKRDINKIITVLVEGFSKRSKERLFGRTSQNKVVIFPREHFDIGDYVKVKITNCTSATMFGEVVLK